MSSSKRNINKKGKWFFILMYIILTVILFVLLLGIFSYLNIIRLPFLDADKSGNSYDIPAVVSHEWTDVPEESVLDYIDSEEYYEENSEIVSVVPVNDSDNNVSEEELIYELNERGFDNIQVTTSYSMDGEYSDPEVITDSSEDEHPSYEFLYVSESDEYWSVIVIDGKIMALPLSYNLVFENVIPIVVSETGEVVSYDSSTNSYFYTIPNNDRYDVRTVERIDAVTLAEMTVEELENG